MNTILVVVVLPIGICGLLYIFDKVKRVFRYLQYRRVKDVEYHVCW